jgi:hypothetical protein
VRVPRRDITIVLTRLKAAAMGPFVRANRQALRDWAWNEGLDVYEPHTAFEHPVDGSIWYTGAVRDLFSESV